jgi:hypothetical protein
MIFGKDLLNINLKRIQCNINKNIQRSSYKVCINVARFESNLNFLARFFRNPKILNFMKIHPLGAKLLRAHRLTDRHGQAKSCFAILGTCLKVCNKNCGTGNEHSIGHGQLVIKYNSENIK